VAVITEDESTCVVWMPRSVVDAGLSTIAKPLHNVADAIVYCLSKPGVLVQDDTARCKRQIAR
jgi:chemotaxis response regulator CheB